MQRHGPTTDAVDETGPWLGDHHPLLEQLGSMDGLLSLGTATSMVGVQPVATLGGMSEFLRRYHERVFLAIELPAICQAFGHARRNELRELVELDRKLAGEAGYREFAAASRKMGRLQLERLRPLRDQRLVQRYLQAVEDGEAFAWHTLVYGMTLALYSLPLRQGVLDYGCQVYQGFIRAAARPLQLSNRETRELFSELTDPLAAAVEAMPRGDAAD